ncbi:hypothetical protein HPP92_005513 [Vanilla planifolia]|uniref:Uncharacterized protein n=1 Tax=Vanilla planifolia TaxID=51239 RepID=A0A835RSA1_VANPL|nr:hypothetical protein HPP92_005509 [Vanilla planifolia]KAG0494519.1 hypothetical protein HPP92_005513 [Vanilla planifolia]
MAIRCSFPDTAILAKAKSSMITSRDPKPENRLVQLKNTTSSLKKFTQVNKVYEDKENGVLCYRDEKGELICEGYDEGPRFTWQPPQGIKSQAEKSSMDARPMLRISELNN